MINNDDPFSKAALSTRMVVETLRRDAVFVWHVVIIIMFVAFAMLAVGAALIDLLPLRH